MACFQGNPLKQLRAVFSRFDANSDGSITRHELASLLRSVGLKPTPAQVRALLVSVDSNGNGAVEFPELAAAIAPALMERMLVDRQRLMGVFWSFDRDGSGYITAAELAHSMGHPLTIHEFPKKEADTDGDCVIRFSEFASIVGKVRHYSSLALYRPHSPSHAGSNMPRLTAVSEHVHRVPVAGWLLVHITGLNGINHTAIY